MLSKMWAVVTPQTVINNCMKAVEMTGLGRGEKLVDDLSIDHFGFYLRADDYDTVGDGLHDMLDHVCAVQLPGDGRATMGQQKKLANNKALSWYYGNPLPALAVVRSQALPLQAGGGYLAMRTTNMQASRQWLFSHGIECQTIRPYGLNALWVPLETPDWGVGYDYYALCVVTESLLETARRLSAAQ